MEASQSDGQWWQQLCPAAGRQDYAGARVKMCTIAYDRLRGLIEAGCGSGVWCGRSGGRAMAAPGGPMHGLPDGKRSEPAPREQCRNWYRARDQFSAKPVSRTRRWVGLGKLS